MERTEPPLENASPSSSFPTDKRDRAVRILVLTVPLSIPFTVFLWNRFQNHALFFSAGLCLVTSPALALILFWETVRRKRRLWELMSYCALFAIAVSVMGVSGRVGEAWLFESIEEELLSWIEQNEDQLQEEWTLPAVPSDLSHVVDAIGGQRYENESFFVEFHTFGTIPARHKGFLYVEGNSQTMHIHLNNRWSGQRKIDENWIVFSG